MVVLAMVAAACGSDDTSDETTATTSAPAATTTTAGATDATTTTVEDMAPCSTATPDGCAGTIVLGAAVSETGRFSREGKDTRQGYGTWADWVNEEYGGVNVGGDHYLVELIQYDDEGDADTAANLVERLITEDEVDFLLGPYSSGLTMGTSAIAEKYGVIMVEGNGASETIFERGFENIFAVLTPAGNYTQTAIKALADAGAETMVLAYEDTAFPTSVAQGALRWADEYGLEVLGTETYPLNVADVSAIMTKFKDTGADIFVGGGHFNDALLFVRGAKDVGWTPKGMVLTVGPSNPEFAAEVGVDANYILGPTQWEASMSWSDEWFGTAAEFAARYQEKWGEKPSYQAAESTATGLALHLAIELAASLDTDAVRQALYDLNVNTFYGPIDFDDTGKNAGKPMGAIQILDGATQVVAPAEAKVADLVYPMPAWEDR
ncbi:MAG: amino acid ABC transporter substrate-binding protein [Acidimicrobiia bacterium]|nr:amino acid ABC transporter substrate-binding protein [Acidimicrobiia bacterium]